MSSRMPALPWEGGGVPGLLQNDVFLYRLCSASCLFYMGTDDFGEIPV